MTFESLTWVPAGHFYSPLVDPSDARVQSIAANHSQLELSPDDESLAIDDARQLRTLEDIRAAYGLMEFPVNPAPDFRYYYENPAFSYSDAIAYFGLLHSIRPKRVIEVGSGFSSCLLMDANDRFLDGAIVPTFIDPYPETLLGLLPEDDPYRKNIVAEPLQDVPTELFRELQRDDFLFIDSSHVLKTGSDVCDYLFRILPALRSGVVIHIHDIFYPFEPSPAWIMEENRSWNESYAIRAFLQYNERYEIIYFCHYMFRKHLDLLDAATPNSRRNCGGSLWLRKK